MSAAYALQRRIKGRDSARWRTVCYLSEERHVLPAMTAAVALARVSDPLLELRLMKVDEQGVHRETAAWTLERGWVDSAVTVPDSG